MVKKGALIIAIIAMILIGLADLLKIAVWHYPFVLGIIVLIHIIVIVLLAVISGKKDKK